MLAALEVSDVSAIYQLSDENGESRTRFRCSDLRGKVVAGLVLHCSDWIECELSGAIFRDCDLRGADFSSSVCSRARFERCSMYGCYLPDDASIELMACRKSL
jgi:uncharacterized protein YjbI with pentapeptide repeats